MNKTIFRKVSLDRLSSPEQLDQLMKVTSPKGWLMLLGIAILLVSAVIWGFTGQLATKVTGQGVLIQSGGEQSITTEVSGSISDVTVKADQLVKRGQVIARISQPALVEMMSNVQDQMDLARQSGESVSGLNQKLDELRQQYYNATRIVSPYDARVLEVKVKRGDLVTVGTPVVSLELMHDNKLDLEAIMYIPATEGKRVQPGMAVQVSPTSINKEKNGFMEGRVTAVSQFPATARGIYQTIGNQTLAELFSSGVAVLQVTVSLIPDPSTVSGYKWSTPQGPDMKVNNGTLFGGAITVQTEKPISKVIPGL